MKKNTLAAGLKAAAGRQGRAAPPPARSKASKSKAAAATVLIGANYQPEVRSALFLVQAEPENSGKSLKRLLGEAINDLCAKYGKPQPYSPEDL